MKLKEFLRITLYGGFLVILPGAILLLVLKWTFVLITDLLQPITEYIHSHSGMSVFIAKVLALIAVLAICFVVGLLVRSEIGNFLHHAIEKNFLSKFPGYVLIKESLSQFIGNKKAPFSRVALVSVFDKDVMMTAFVTDEHENGHFTVFVPTGPNPTSGNIYHLPPERVILVDIPVQEAMRTIISCGAGSSNLITDLDAKTKKIREDHEALNSKDTATASQDKT